MKYGIIGAMEEEISLLKERLSKIEMIQVANFEIVTGYLGKHQIYLMKSGIGKVNATISTTLLIQHCQPDVIINTGSAGALDPGLKVGDIVIGQAFRYHDVDVTSFGYQLGQMAGMPAEYFPDSVWVRSAQTQARLLNKEPVICTIVSGDQFIGNQAGREKIRQNFPRARACEMESTAIAQTCSIFNVPFVIIRAISDQADGSASIDFDQFIIEAGRTAASLVEAMIMAS
ncbi:methylthioadenosine nucleosidase /adenosylhomocysteine nucleosidase [Ignavigranum ruoffiae]|uniref:5'-methylthioadenosine/S-adenosylhomocysteine nucleosidase n=1 Tax=Ignavigranum ruoffiae TaxID=89093 RepID=A0A1H9E6H3_9LACT|nr:5'-methylthioadenosine/adenosylhomocysteine nucleosidase [Ignavigranum ruoffiae]SEQ20833.1 methylthioadenosine nucleosidase /adenosylhomocysteine nucleosidase [Ignavigranum ruoffiae]